MPPKKKPQQNRGESIDEKRGATTTERKRGNSRSESKSNQERNVCKPERFSSFRYRIITGLNPEKLPRNNPKLISKTELKILPWKHLRKSRISLCKYGEGERVFIYEESKETTLQISEI